MLHLIKTDVRQRGVSGMLSFVLLCIPLHFELARIGGKPTAGVIKEVVMLEELEFDFVADNRVLTLFHCHQQLHMDFGFMALFNYA